MATTLQIFMLAMSIHPDVYLKAQEEMDRVVGSARLPELDDRKDLPYLDAVIKEVYRYVTQNALLSCTNRLLLCADGTSPSLWVSSKCTCQRSNVDRSRLGIPHTTMKDDEFEGCRIPKGTMVISNLW